MIVSQINGDTLRGLRKLKGLSQFQLACDIQVEQNIISLIENNKRPGLRIDTIVRISKYFNVTIEYLLENNI